MTQELLRGERVRLAAPDPDQGAEQVAGWHRDSEYSRLLDSDPARPVGVREVTDWLGGEPKPTSFNFWIRTLADDRLIGFGGLWLHHWTHRDAWLGIGIGERADWGQGYGTDAVRVLVRFGFLELGLHRVSLSVFGYNPRAQRAYAKAGFVAEGRIRQLLARDGQRWDEVVMGILYADWLRTQAPAPG